MGVVRSFADGLVNLVANLGTDRDKAAHTQYGVPTLTDVEAVNACRSAWLPRKIVEIPALDAMRNWRGWQAESQQVTALEAEEKRLGLRGKLLDAYTKARLFGGAALYIGTGDANAAEELRPDRIRRGGIRHLNVLTKRVLQAGEIERDPESPRYGLPSYYTMRSDKAGAVKIHPSRLVILQGVPKPDAELSGVNDGWGDSVLTAIMDEIKRADGTSANIASLVFEAKIDVLKIPDFMAQMSDPAYESDMLKRLQLAAMAKGINGALVLDKEEEYEQKSAQFGSLRDILLAFMQLVSGAADIPVTRLLGQSPGGLNASGDADIRNYYDRIRATQELTLQPAMEVLDECLIRSALGSRDPDVFYNWNSLWQTSEKDRADIGKTTADTIKTLADTALIPDEVLAKVAVNMLTEAGVAPGLESEMDDYQPQDGGGPTDEELAATQAVTDAAPRPLYVHRKVLNAAEIIAWAKAQGFETTLPAGDMHVTIAFSRAPVDWMAAGRDWNSDEDGRLRVKPGGPRMIEKFGEGAIVLTFASDELTWRHERFAEIGASWDHAEYQPHITLTYTQGDVRIADVEPYTGPIVLGPELFEPLDEDWKTKVAEG